MVKMVNVIEKKRFLLVCPRKFEMNFFWSNKWSRGGVIWWGVGVFAIYSGIMGTAESYKQCFNVKIIGILTRCSPESTSSSDMRLSPSRRSSNRSFTWRLACGRHQKIRTSIKHHWARYDNSANNRTQKRKTITIITAMTTTRISEITTIAAITVIAVITKTVSAKEIKQLEAKYKQGKNICVSF